MINNLHIPNPCHENWNGMFPDENGRFCSSCKKTVVDFTNKTDQEIIDYFAANAGTRACGKFKATQLKQPEKISFQHQHTLKFVAACLLVFGMSLFSCNSDEKQPKAGPAQEIMGGLSYAPVDSAEVLPDSIIRKSVHYRESPVEEDETPAVEPDIQTQVIDEAHVIDTPLTQPEILGVVIEDMPQFPGGQTALLQYIKENIRYPQSAKDQGLSGKVYVGFKVMETGKIDSVRLLRGFYDSCDMEALRVIRVMPDWIPAQRNGKPINVQINLPILFKMQ